MTCTGITVQVDQAHMTMRILTDMADGRKLPIIDGRTGREVEFAPEVNRLRFDHEMRAFLDRVKASVQG